MKIFSFLLFFACAAGALAPAAHPFKACHIEYNKRKAMCTPGGLKSGVDSLKNTTNGINKFNSEYQFKNEMKIQGTSSV